MNITAAIRFWMVLAILCSFAWVPTVAQEPSPKPGAGQTLAMDRHGERLPSGAIARMGSFRWRQGTALHDLALTPDGKIVVIVGETPGSEIVLWDRATGNEVRRIEHRWALRAVLSPDATKLASCGVGYSLLVSELATGKKLWEAKTNATPFSLAFSPDGTILAHGDEKIHLWDVASGKKLRTIERKGNRVAALAFSPDGAFLAGEDDGTLKLWDPKTGQLNRALDGDWVTVSSLVISPDGKTLFADKGTQGVCMWDTATGKIAGLLHNQPYALSSIAISRDGKLLAAGVGSTGADRRRYYDHSIRVWDLETRKLIRELPGHGHSVMALQFTPDGKTLASACSSVRFWDLISGKRLTHVEGHEDVIQALRFTADSQQLLSASPDRTVRRWDARTGRELEVKAGLPAPLGSIVFSPGGKYLAADNGNQTIRVYQTHDLSEHYRNDEKEDVSALAFTSDGQQLVWRRESSVRFLDIAEKKIKKAWHAMNATSNSFDPSGRFAASAIPMTSGFAGGFGGGPTTKGAIKVRRMDSGSVYHHFDTKDAWSNGVKAFSPDGKTLVVAEENVYFLELATATVRAQIKMDQGGYIATP